MSKGAADRYWCKADVVYLKAFSNTISLFQGAFKASICNLLSVLSLPKLWLNKLCVALLESRYIHSSPLYLLLCPLSDSSVVTIVNPTQAAPVWSAKMLPGAEHWKMSLLLFTERKKIYGSIIGAVRPVWVCDGLNWGEIKSTNVVELFVGLAFAASFTQHSFV